MEKMHAVPQLNKNVVLYFEMSHCAKLRFVGPDEKTIEFIDQSATQNELKAITSDVYVPVLDMIRKIIDRYTGVRIAFSSPGSTLQAVAHNSPAIIDSIRELVNFKAIEWLGMPYNNSISLLYSDEAFREEVIRSNELLYEFFGVQPRVLLASPVFAPSMMHQTSELGFDALLLRPNIASGQTVLKDSSEDIMVLVADSIISDAITYRFGAGEVTLTVCELVAMVNRAPGDTVVIGIPMEAFRLHHGSNILRFFEEFISLAASHDRLALPSEAVREMSAHDFSDPRQLIELSMTKSHLLTNDLQKEAFAAAKELDDATRDLVDNSARHALMQLLNAEYYSSMSHSCANLSGPYLSPQEVFGIYMSALQSLSRVVSASAVKENETAAKSVEAMRQHPSTPTWALNEQSRYQENTHSSI
ncbi:MAG: hypothetical protein QM762_02480 [Chryseolinea sp.]